LRPGKKNWKPGENPGIKNEALKFFPPPPPPSLPAMP